MQLYHSTGNPNQLTPRTSVIGRGWFRPTSPNFFFSLKFSLSPIMIGCGVIYLIHIYYSAGFGRLSLADARRSKNHENHGLSQQRIYMSATCPATMRSIPEKKQRDEKLIKIMGRYCDCEYCEPDHIPAYYSDGSSGYECDVCDKEVYFEVDTDEGDIYFIRASEIPKVVSLWWLM